jgi:hypothetical protein
MNSGKSFKCFQRYDVGSLGSRSSSNSNESTQSMTSDCSRQSSRSIPVAKCIRRTPSEVQFLQEQAIADHRDFCMYSRIISGISRQQMTDNGFLDLRHENDETLGNIIRTRHYIESEYMDSKCGLDTYLYYNDEDWGAPSYSDIHSSENGIFYLEL